MGIENRENKLYITSAETKKGLDDIRKVGPNKPVGYLPIETITDFYGIDVKELISESRAKGLRFKIFTGSEWPGYKGVLYVYDQTALQDLLNEKKNHEILLKASWPTEAEEFVAHLYVDVPTGTPLFKLIARAFGDRFSENL